MTLARIEREGDIALVILNNPPVNALSHALRSALLNAIADVETSDARAAILLCDGKTFIAGADISEFGAPLQKPITPDIIAAIETSSKIWITALHGTVLGAGLELALGCDARIASEGTQLGFPEVTLGLIPGAGGTQRTPRLIGLQAALGLMTSGRRVDADEAKNLGLIDEIADGDLRQQALAFAKKITGKAILPDRVEIIDRDALGKTLADITRKARGQVAPVEAAHAVMLSTELPLSDGLKEEREIFETLTRSVQSRALRYQFFATREAMKIPKLEHVPPADITTIGIIGAGTMGRGIASACLIAGYSTVLIDKDSAALPTAWAAVESNLVEAAKRGLLDVTSQQAMTSLIASDDLNELKRCDLVIEAVFEDMAVKAALLKELGTLLPQHTLLASNTSYLDIDALAQASGRPDRFFGLHFFAPAHIMKLVEIVDGAATSGGTLASGVAVVKRLKKTGVYSRNGQGFIGNRIWQAYRREIEYMVEDGTSPYAIDAAMLQFGFAMGPFQVADLSGLDIAFAQRQRSAPTRPPSERYVDIPDLLCALRRLGRKAGRGWYEYEDGTAREAPDVLSLIAAEQQRKSITPKTLPPQAVQARCLAVIVNEAAKLLDEKVALRASDIDLVMVTGYGWPKWRGGPLFEADEISVANMLPLLVTLAKDNGLVISEGLKAKALNNTRFAA